MQLSRLLTLTILGAPLVAASNAAADVPKPPKAKPAITVDIHVPGVR